MYVQNKLKIKGNNILNKKKTSIYNRLEEEVQQLNIDETLLNKYDLDTNNDINMSLNNHLDRKMSKKLSKYFNIEEEERKFNQLQMPSAKSMNILKDINEESFSFNNLSFSIQKLKTIIPNISEKIMLENPIKEYSTSKTFQIHYENYLNSILKQFNMKEKEMKQNKERLENELKTIEENINDKELNIELIKNMTFQKNVKQKIINKYENEYKQEQNNIMLNNINNSVKTIDKKELFFIENKYKDEYDLKVQKMKEAKKLTEKKDVKSILNGKTFKTKLSNILLGNQILSKYKSEKFAKEIEQYKENKKLIWEDIKFYSHKLKSLHILQGKIKDKLYIHYLNILKEGNDTRDEGLSWVIAEILNLGKKVLMSYIPKYLDEKCILYLFLNAHIILKIKFLEDKINESKSHFLERKTKKHKIKTENRNLKTIQKLKSIKEKFIKNNSEIVNKKIPNIEDERNILTSELKNSYRASKIFMEETKKRLSKSSTMFFKGNLKNYYEGGNEYKILNHVKFKDVKKLSLKKHKKISFDEYIALKDEIGKLKKLKGVIKEEEMKRIFKEFHSNKYLERYNIDKDTILSALIGEENISNESFAQNRKEKKLFDEIRRIRLYKKGSDINDGIRTNNNIGLLRYNNSFISKKENLKFLNNKNIEHIYSFNKV